MPEPPYQSPGRGIVLVHHRVQLGQYAAVRVEIAVQPLVRRHAHIAGLVFARLPSEARDVVGVVDRLPVVLRNKTGQNRSGFLNSLCRCVILFGQPFLAIGLVLGQPDLVQPNPMLIDEGDQVGLVDRTFGFQELVEPDDPLDLGVLDAVLLQVREPLLAAGFFLGVGLGGALGLGVEGVDASAWGALALKEC